MAAQTDGKGKRSVSGIPDSTRKLKNNTVSKEVLCCSKNRNSQLYPICNEITYVFASNFELEPLLYQGSKVRMSSYPRQPKIE